MLDVNRIQRSVDAQIRTFSLDERSTITLFYLKEVTIEEIGFIVGKPEGTVKGILHRVRRKLRNKLKELESVTVENGDVA